MGHASFRESYVLASAAMSIRWCALVLLLLPACGPGASGGADAGTPDGGRMPLDAPPPPAMMDARPMADRPQPLFDAPPGFTVYVHTATELFTMDPGTFALRRVGAFGVMRMDGSPEQMTDLAVTPDGVVYTVASAGGTSRLYRVDARTAAATFVIEIAMSASLVGMTFLPDNTLLAADKIGDVYQLDPAAGTSRRIGSYGMMLSTAGDLVAVADGTMYGISDKQPGGDSAAMNNVLLRVDTQTGRATPVGTGIGFGKVFGVAYFNGRVMAFTEAGEIVEIDRATGRGNLLMTVPMREFWGAGVTPLVTID